MPAGVSGDATAAVEPARTRRSNRVFPLPDRLVAALHSLADRFGLMPSLS
jgi:hypothetical protein